jgi:hypothetical protein
MNVIFQINGGIGKCVMSTSICKSIKEKYPESKLIVVSGYPEVYLNNPYVDRSFAFGTAAYFYEDFLENEDFIVLGHDPYLETGHLKQREHLTTTWSKMFSLPVADKKPELFLTDRERQFFTNKFASEKPILLLQTNGGAQQQELKYSWARDIPVNVVLPVIEEFKNDYHIVHIKREDQIGYPDTTPVSDNFRALCILIELSTKRLLMDSFAQHAAAALNKPSTVCWIANKPEVFGYDLHTNILPNKFTRKPELKHSYLQKFDISGNLIEFPYNNEKEIFNIDEIISSLK